MNFLLASEGRPTKVPPSMPREGRGGVLRKGRARCATFAHAVTRPGEIGPQQEGGTPIMRRKILVMGLPGAGKTTLARLLVPRLNAVHFNADEVRTHINQD